MSEIFTPRPIQSIIDQALTEIFGCVNTQRSPIRSLVKRLISSQGKELMDIVPSELAGYVYLVWAMGTPRYKIGRSVDPSRRIEELNKQSCYPLKLVEQAYFDDCVYHEKRAHRILAEYRVHGEWFELPKRLLLSIDSWLKNPDCHSVKLAAEGKIALTVVAKQRQYTEKQEASATSLRFEKLGIKLAKHLYLPPYINIPEDFDCLVKVCVILKQLSEKPRKSWNWKLTRTIKDEIGGLPVNQEQAKEWFQILSQVKGHQKRAIKAAKLAAAENATSTEGGATCA